VLQSAWLFLALSAVLWWGTIVPRRNLFDAAYNCLAYSRGLARTPVAPAPRRFALPQGGSTVQRGSRTGWHGFQRPERRKRKEDGA
jgi:hypothetical protein